MKRALMSVSDKRNLIPFATGLKALGYEILSTGGTARALQEAGIDVTPVSDVTKFPEILDGRVKTLHPMIHGGLLAKDTPEHRAALTQLNIQPIDLVVVNLYPFQETIQKPDATLADAIENIDIGGPSMLRSAAKNHARVGVVVHPESYNAVLEEMQINEGNLTQKTRQLLALDAFRHTAQYDASIATYLTDAFEAEPFGPDYAQGGKQVQMLRYGENPHQRAAFYAQNPVPGNVAGAKQLNGKALSYNNLVDVDAAWQLVNEFQGQNACAIIKHTNPCGCALGSTPAEAYARALSADPKSAFGGIIAMNQGVDAETASLIIETFMEAVIAPLFSEEALTILKQKPNLRVLETGIAKQETAPWVEQISGGFLVQERDTHQVTKEELTTVTQITPDETAIDDLLFAWKIVKHVKSNAIVVAKNGQTLGVGAGQMNRVGSCAIAFQEAGEAVKGAVLASDAFFPFRDSIDMAAQVGIKAIIQPGGSVQDESVIDACNELGIAMVTTQIRHFKH